jgi:ubiquinone/menaquinone biosynthesis C-methylase UbiE
MNKVKEWYENSYKNAGFKAQRRYPNEELLRFFGKYFFDSHSNHGRKKIKVLEVGCGSCSNLWMVAKEGFDAYGLDLSTESLKLGEKMLGFWETTANLKQGSFLDLPYEDDTFDVVIDVFSLYCVDHKDFSLAIDESYRVLKDGGLFFSYTPSQNSDAFKEFAPAIKLDESTLNGIHRETSPFSGNHYPFHFWNEVEYKKTLMDKDFSVCHMESISRSYNDRHELFEHIVVHAKK